jgi:hypothetical protein
MPLPPEVPRCQWLRFAKTADVPTLRPGEICVDNETKTFVFGTNTGNVTLSAGGLSTVVVAASGGLTGDGSKASPLRVDSTAMSDNGEPPLDAYLAFFGGDGADVEKCKVGPFFEGLIFGDVELVATTPTTMAANIVGIDGVPTVNIASGADIAVFLGYWEVSPGVWTIQPRGFGGDVIYDSIGKNFVVQSLNNGALIMFDNATKNQVVIQDNDGNIDVTPTLSVTNGGTGADSLTGYVKGTGTTPFTAAPTIPGSDISGVWELKDSFLLSQAGGNINDAAIGNVSRLLIENTSGGGSLFLNGIAGGYTGRTVLIHFIGPGTRLLFINMQSAGSLTANRFGYSGDQTLTMRTGDLALATYYDNRWNVRIVSNDLARSDGVVPLTNGGTGATTAAAARTALGIGAIGTQSAWPGSISGTAIGSSATWDIPTSAMTNIPGLVTGSLSSGQTYLIIVDVRHILNLSGVGANAYYILELYDNTGTPVANSETFGAEVRGDGVILQGNASAYWIVTPPGLRSYTVRALLVVGSGTVTTCQIRSSNIGRSRLIWHRINY